MFNSLFEKLKTEKSCFPAESFIQENKGEATNFWHESFSEKKDFLERLKSLEAIAEIFEVAISFQKQGEIALLTKENFEKTDYDLFGHSFVNTPENLRVTYETQKGYTKKSTALPPYPYGYREGKTDALSHLILRLEKEDESSSQEKLSKTCRMRARQIACSLQPDCILIQRFSWGCPTAYVMENGFERLYTGSTIFFYWQGNLQCQLGEAQWIHGKYLEHFKKHPTLWNECLAELRAIEGSFVEEFLNGIYIDVGTSEVHVNKPDSISRVNKRAREAGEILKRYHKRTYDLLKS